jgi:hypothetical protein
MTPTELISVMKLHPSPGLLMGQLLSDVSKNNILVGDNHFYNHFDVSYHTTIPEFIDSSPFIPKCILELRKQFIEVYDSPYRSVTMTSAVVEFFIAFNYREDLLLSIATIICTYIGDDIK